MRTFHSCWRGIACSMALGIVAFVLNSCSIERVKALMISLQEILTGLALPVAITHAGDGSGRLFITLQGGRTLIYDGSRLLPTPFLDIGSLVSCCGEQGLLSVAFHPSYEQDGYLYIGMGDGGSYGDPEKNAENGQTLLGKILRIDVNNVNTSDGLPYDIPANNPFINDPDVRDEIWALGLRNPWRFSFDRATGDLFIGDAGESGQEEVNFQSASTPSGENYGWRLMEGKHCFHPSTNCNDGALTLPILEYDHSLGCSITGGYRYRGAQIPQLYGVYLYGDYCSGRIWGATKSDGRWSTAILLDTDLSISSFGEDGADELYVAHHDDVKGTIYRIITKR